jgi:uncharacterized protein (DUF1778 family)
MANATERITVLVTPENKTEIERRARANGLSVGAFMRDAALGPSLAEEAALVEALHELDAANSETEAALQRLTERMDERAKTAPDRERKARAEGRALAKAWLERAAADALLRAESA